MHECRDKQHSSGSFTNIGYGNGNQSENDKRYGEIEEFSKDGVEGHEQPYQRCRQEISDSDTKYNSYDDTWQKSYVYFLHYEVLAVCYKSNTFSETIRTNIFDMCYR